MARKVLIPIKLFSPWGLRKCRRSSVVLIAAFTNRRRMSAGSPPHADVGVGCLHCP